MAEANTNTYIAQGSCLCSAVHYKLTSPPQARYLCHCGHCKKTTGSILMADWWYLATAHQFTAGEESIRTFTSDLTNSGFSMTRTFCSICGSLLLLRSARETMKDKVAVPIGTLDGEENRHWKPDSEFFVENRGDFLNQGVEGAKQVNVKDQNS